MLITIFLVFTAIFIFATVCFIKLAYFSIQPNQWFDTIFNWQHKLNSWYESKSKFKNFLAKAGGDCPMCFSHWLCFLSFWVYYFVDVTYLRYWITDIIDFEHTWRGNLTFWALNLIWYVIYISITTVLSAMFISKTSRL